MPVETSFVSQVFIIGTYLSSLAALFFLFQRHIFGMRLLAYEPRYRVPWGLSVALLALLFPLLGIVSALLQVDSPKSPQTIVEQHAPEIVDDVEEVGSDDASSDDANVDGSDFVTNAVVTTTLMLLFVVGIALLLRATVNANSSDLGIPQNKEELVHGIKAGVVGALASILPVFIIQLLLILALQPETEHPLIEELKQTHTPAMMLMGMLMVVVAAPICEEFTFRLLFQGWLEKFEDELMGFTATERPQPVLPLEEDDVDALSENGETLADEPTDEEPDVIPLSLTPQPMQLPREGLLPGVPHGWLPILSSGTIFGIAHLGHGVSPVPLVLFGIVLGYLYQRTHRLVAPIVAHAVFNSYSMILLWLSLG